MIKLSPQGVCLCGDSFLCECYPLAAVNNKAERELMNLAAKSGRMQFFIAFLMGIVILAMPFSYALFRFSGSRPEIPSASEGYYPQSSDSILLAIALKNDEKDLPNCFVLCRISPLEGSVTMAVLPPETLVEDAGSFYSADVVWVREGGKRGAAAIQATVGVLCERWLEIDSQALVRLGDVTGAIDFTLDEIRDDYGFYETCQLSVPQSFEAFFESTSFEDAVRNAVSIGGDSDTIAAVTGSIAEAFYGIDKEIKDTAFSYLDTYLLEIAVNFVNKFIDKE